jgi:hypothetical protein
MHTVPVVGGSRAVGGGSDEWVRELDTPTDLEQLGVHCRAGRCHVESKGLSGTVEQYGVAEGLRGRGKDQQLGVGGEHRETPDVTLFDLAGYRLALGQPEPAGETGSPPGARQLEEREGVTMALRDELVTDGRIQRAVHISQQQRACIAVAEATDR